MNWMYFKLKWPEVVTYMAVLLAPIYPAMLALTFVLSIDFVTGVWASRRRGEAITSKRMSRSVSKLILYNLLIITALIVETFLLQAIPLTKLAIGFLGLVEIKSVAENITSLTGVDFWKALMAYLRRKGIDELDGSQKEPKDDTVEDESKELKE